MSWGMGVRWGERGQRFISEINCSHYSAPRVSFKVDCTPGGF